MMGSLAGVLRAADGARAGGRDPRRTRGRVARRRAAAGYGRADGRSVLLSPRRSRHARRAVTHGDPVAASVSAGLVRRVPRVDGGRAHAGCSSSNAPRRSRHSVTALVTVVPMYLVPARWLGRRALEVARANAPPASTLLVKAVARMTAPRHRFAGFSVRRCEPAAQPPAPPRARDLLRAGDRNLRRQHSAHRGARDLRASTHPASWVLALPLVFMFFSVLGLRASFRIPTEIEANWPFRLAQPSLAHVRQCHGARDVHPGGAADRRPSRLRHRSALGARGLWSRPRCCKCSPDGCSSKSCCSTGAKCRSPVRTHPRLMS